MAQEKAQSYLKQVVSSINFLSKPAKKEAYKRGLDILPEVLSLKPFKGGIHEIRDLAREEFRAGVQRYIIGFYDDSIHHSTLSVEISLLIRLEETLTTSEKEAIHDKINRQDGKPPMPFTFGSIFDEIKRNKIITDEQVKTKIAQIIETRNAHIHAGNLTSASVLSMKEVGPPQIERGLKMLSKLESNAIVGLIAKKWLPQAKNILIETRTSIDGLPSFEWCTKDKQRTKTQRGVNEYFNDVFSVITGIENLQSVSEKVQMGLHSKEIIHELSSDTYHKRKALETLHEAYMVLKFMDFFEDKSEKRID